MALDYLTTVYKRERNSPRNHKTSYAVMSRWMDAIAPPHIHARISVNHYGTGRLSPEFAAKKRPWNRTRPPDRHGTQGPEPGVPGAAKLAAIDGNLPVHLRYSRNCGYDDYHKAFLAISNQWPSDSYPTFGPPRLRHGRQGGSWRHVTEVVEAGGKRAMFVDGRTSLRDRYSMETIPGAELIVGREPEPPINFVRDEAKQTAWMFNYRRQKSREPKMKLAIYGDLEKHQSVEKNNWLIMR